MLTSHFLTQLTSFQRRLCGCIFHYTKFEQKQIHGSITSVSIHSSSLWRSSGLNQSMDKNNMRSNKEDSTVYGCLLQRCRQSLNWRERKQVAQTIFFFLYIHWPFADQLVANCRLLYWTVYIRRCAWNLASWGRGAKSENIVSSSTMRANQSQSLRSMTSYGVV